MNQNNDVPTLQRFFIEQSSEQAHYHSVSTLTLKVALLACSTFYYGYYLTALSSFTPSALQTVWGQLASDPGIYGLLIGILPVGAMVGAGSAPFLMFYFSRKQFLLLINSLTLLVALILQINTLSVLMVCRFFQGIFVGCYMAITPIYIHEIVPKQIRGSYGVFTQLFVAIGTVVSYALGLLLTKVSTDAFVHYRVIMLASCIVTIVQSAMLVTGFVPESPCSLILRGKEEQAKSVIRQFTKQQYVNEVYLEKYSQVELLPQASGMREVQPVSPASESNRSSQLTQISTTSNISTTNSEKIIYSFRAFLLAFQLPFMQQLTGTNGITTQVNNMVAAVAPNIADYVGLVINVIKLIATMAAVLVVTRYGRKTITLSGNLALGAIDMAIAVLFVLGGWEPSGYLIFLLLIAFNIVYGVTLGPIIWLYVPEIIPAKVVPLATMTNWLGQTICIVLTPIVTNANQGNPYPIFLMFGGVTLLFWVVNYYLMVETRGKSRKEIAASFRKENNILTEDLSKVQVV